MMDQIDLSTRKPADERDCAADRRPPMTALYGGAIALLLTAWSAEAHAFYGVCSATAELVKRACLAENRDDHWIALGNCLNISDWHERRACLADAREEGIEASALCADQLEARRELCAAIGEGVYEPEVTPLVIGGTMIPLFIPDNFPEDPAQTLATANPYFPLVPGMERVYELRDDGGELVEQIILTVEEEVKNIGGVNCLTLRDVVREGDEPDDPVIEDTDDWYAQDLDGNVWYCGEIAQNFEIFEEDPDPQIELVDVEGSWKGFRDFAKPGIIMLAVPMVGDVYRQELALGNAEDAAEVISTSASESVPAASCTADCVLTKDFTPIDPEVFEYKYYAPGVGPILEIDPETGERLELVTFTTP